MNDVKLDWSKTLLGVYKYLDRIAGAIDIVFERRAKNSYYSTTKNIGKNNAMNLTSNLIDLIDSKIKAINLKILIGKSLLSMPKENAKVLIFKYIDDYSSSDISLLMGFSERTYFRKLNTALYSFRAEILKRGYSDEKLYNMLKDENWIMEAYNSIKEIKKDENIFNENYVSNVCSKLKKIFAYS